MYESVSTGDETKLGADTRKHPFFLEVNQRF